MDKLHLLCNAHLDPAWLWRWNEGAAEAVSTFRVAADFCEEYDGFVFNHNEALLYEWIEEYEPELFQRISRLIKDGKWIVMGGWYLQPDCLMPSGESMIEQIELGRKYFKEKFGVCPTTAVNVDPFGHSRGLVQVLNKTGYKGYIFMRPYEIKGDFIWEGFDGSRVIAHGIYGGYNTLKGQALDKIKEYINTEDKSIGLCLWGIGDHGGGPSRVDLEQINEYINSNSEISIVHSSADEYIAQINETKLPVIKKSLIPCMVGCYTSMVRVKQAHRRLENKIAATEKIMSYASMSSGLEYDNKSMEKAKKALAFCQFHDILPGSAVDSVEEDSLRTLAYGEEITDMLYQRAFFKLCEGQTKAKDGEIPIMVFNPHPFEIEGEFEVEFMLEDQNWSEEEITSAVVLDSGGKQLPTQNEKPKCTFNLDWRQKVCFKATVAPSSISRFDCRLKRVKKNNALLNMFSKESIEIENDKMKVLISRSTGLIELYEVYGERLIENSGVLEVYKDNEDPWGMTVDSFRDKLGEFTLMSDADANEFIGYPDENMHNVRIVENGIVRMKIQALFEYKRTIAVVEYTVPKKGAYIDVDVTIYSNECNKMIKYAVKTQINGGSPYGETMLGCERFFDDERESVYHKWCGIVSDKKRLYIVNNGIYGGSFTDDTIKLSLLRTPMYSAHPINDRQIAPHDRFIKHMDMGERKFSFRITAEQNIERCALVYNEKPELLSFFPSGSGKKIASSLMIDNPNIILLSIKQDEGGYMLHLNNFSECETEAEIDVAALGKSYKVRFGKYELKMLHIDKNEKI